MVATCEVARYCCYVQSCGVPCGVVSCVVMSAKRNQKAANCGKCKSYVAELAGYRLTIGGVWSVVCEGCYQAGKGSPESAGVSRLTVAPPTREPGDDSDDGPDDEPPTPPRPSVLRRPPGGGEVVPAVAVARPVFVPPPVEPPPAAEPTHVEARRSLPVEVTPPLPALAAHFGKPAHEVPVIRAACGCIVLRPGWGDAGGWVVTLCASHHVTVQHVNMNRNNLMFPTVVKPAGA